MYEQDVFVENLSRLIEDSPLTRRQIAEKAGVSYATLNRWLKVGIARPEGRTRKSLQRVCRALNVRMDDLWHEHLPSRLEECLGLVTELVHHWEQIGCGRRVDELRGRLASCLNAARVVNRFRREEPDLTEVVTKVKMLPGDAEVQDYLEGLVSQWEMDEPDAYKRLIESTKRFLSATLPSDPSDIGAWFRDTHPKRWFHLMEQSTLDSEGEAFAFIRHMISEGLSPLEAYEALVRLSDKPADDV